MRVDSVIFDLKAARLKNLRAALRFEATRKIAAKLRGWWGVAEKREERCAAIRLQIALEEGRIHG